MCLFRVPGLCQQWRKFRILAPLLKAFVGLPIDPKSPLAPPMSHALHALIAVPASKSLKSVWLADKGIEFSQHWLYAVYRSFTAMQMRKKAPRVTQTINRYLHLRHINGPSIYWRQHSQSTSPVILILTTRAFVNGLPEKEKTSAISCARSSCYLQSTAT